MKRGRMSGELSTSEITEAQLMDILLEDEAEVSA